MCSIRILFLGDLMFSGKVGERIAQTGNWAYPFLNIVSRLAEADLVCANLETPLSKAKVPEGFVSEAIYHTDPPVARVLADNHIRVVNLANNHIYDFGAEGVETTLESLAAAGVSYVGIGKDRQNARKPLILEAKGIRIGFLGYCSASTVIRKTNSYAVCPPRADYIQEDVSRLAGQVDCGVVILHEGTGRYPSPEYRKLAKLAVDYGARIVVGHHPHVINGVEIYKNAVIAYGLGNFVADFDPPEYRQTIMLECVIPQSGRVDYRAIPVWINDQYQPEIAEGPQAETLMARFRELNDILASDRSDSAYFAEMNASYWPMMFRELKRSVRAEGLKAVFRKLSKFRIHHLRLLSHKLFGR